MRNTFSLLIYVSIFIRLVGGRKPQPYKNDNYINNIKNNNNITLITPLRINSKKEIINNKILLKERSKVEHFFSLLKRGYKRICIIYDKTLINYSLRPEGSSIGLYF